MRSAGCAALAISHAEERMLIIRSPMKRSGRFPQCLRIAVLCQVTPGTHPSRSGKATDPKCFRLSVDIVEVFGYFQGFGECCRRLQREAHLESLRQAKRSVQLHDLARVRIPVWSRSDAQQCALNASQAFVDRRELIPEWDGGYGYGKAD